MGKLIDTIKKRIKDYLYNQSINEAIYYSKFTQTIVDENTAHLRDGIYAAPLFYLIIIAISFFTEKHFDSIFVVLLFIPEMIIFLFYHHKINQQDSGLSLDPNFACQLFYVVFAVQLILLDTVAFCHTEGHWFHSLMVLFVFFFNTPFRDYLLIYSILTSFYIMMLFTVKDPFFFTKDLFNLIISYFVSIAVARMICNIRHAKASQNNALRVESSYDKLTGLLNKGAAKKEIEIYFSERSSHENVVVISIDADNFKQINDKLGHSSGDIVLSGIGQILRDNFRIDDIVARNGGDEFLVVMKGVVPPFHIDTICRRIQKSVAEISVEGGWPFTCSLGIVIDTYNHDFNTIFSMADDALYECKIRGRDCFSEWYTYNYDYSDGRPLIIISASNGEPTILKVHEKLSENYNVVYAHSGNEVLSLASQYLKKAALILLDMEITRIPAIEVLTYINQRPNFSHIKVLAICPTDEARSMAEEGKADVCLPVPVSSEVVIENSEQLLK